MVTNGSSSSLASAPLAVVAEVEATVAAAMAMAILEKITSLDEDVVVLVSHVNKEQRA